MNNNNNKTNKQTKKAWSRACAMNVFLVKTPLIIFKCVILYFWALHEIEFFNVTPKAVEKLLRF